MSEPDRHGQYMEKHYDVSVIVPIYNVEEYLPDCIDSLLDQGDIDLEIIMIDDGSTDGSGRIADDYADRYADISVYHFENGGLGHARNTGLSLVHGKYVAFMDSDDVIVPGTYERMFAAAEETGSEIAVCNTARFDSTGEWASALQYRLFCHYERITHISKNPYLLYDTSSWNKLFLRSFVEEHHLRFPERILYEDIPFTILAHLLCSQAVILGGIGYLWRVREGQSRSITQNTMSMQNFNDRFQIMEMLDGIFRERVTDPKLRLFKQKRNLDIDLMIFLNNCAAMPEEAALEVMKRLRAYIEANIDPEAFGMIRVIDREKYRRAMELDHEGLVRLCDYQKNGYASAAVTEKNGRLEAVLPEELFPASAAGTEGSDESELRNVRDITGDFADMNPYRFIDQIKVSDRAFEVSAHIYFPRFDIAEADDQKVEVFLINEKTGERIRLETQPVPTEFLTQNFGTVTDANAGIESHYRYDGSGFCFRIDLEELSERAVTDGVWSVLAEYENRLLRGSLFLNGAGPRLFERSDLYWQIVNGTAFRLRFGANRELLLQAVKDPVRISGLDTTCEGALITFDRPVAAARLRAREIRDPRSVPMERESEDTFLLRCGERAGADCVTEVKITPDDVWMPVQPLAASLEEKRRAEEEIAGLKASVREADRANARLRAAVKDTRRRLDGETGKAEKLARESERLANELAREKQKNEDLKASVSYRMGRAVTAPARKVRDGLRK